MFIRSIYLIVLEICQYHGKYFVKQVVLEDTFTI